MADEVISESEARLLRLLFGGAIKPKVKPINSSSSMVVMGGGVAEEPVELDDPEALFISKNNTLRSVRPVRLTHLTPERKSRIRTQRRIDIAS